MGTRRSNHRRVAMQSTAGAAQAGVQGKGAVSPSHGPAASHLCWQHCALPGNLCSASQGCSRGCRQAFLPPPLWHALDCRSMMFLNSWRDASAGLACTRRCMPAGTPASRPA